MRVFAIDQWSRLGVVVDEPSFSDAFEADEAHDMVVASWRDRFGRLRPQVVAAHSGGTRAQSLGLFALHSHDRFRQLRASLALDVAYGWTLTAGGELERRTARVAGVVPEDAYANMPGADGVVFESRIRAERRAAFAEADAWLRERVRVTAGVRIDRSSLTGAWTVDPRIAAAMRVGDGASVSAAWGVYHQVPAPLLYEPETGDPTLGPMRAEHWIVGGELGGEVALLRVEAYRKTYRDLAQQTRD
jgi:outer membrane receptor protein involved in Fe transport